MSKFGLYLRLFLLLAFIGAVGFSGYSVYSGMYAVAKDSPNAYTFVVEEGDTLDKIITKFEKDDVVNSGFWFALQTKLNEVNPILEGEYVLEDLPASPESLIVKLNEQTEKIATINAQYNRPVVKGVLIKEGKSLDEVIDVITEEGVSTKAELQAYAQDPSNFDRVKYPFLPKPLDCTYGNIKTCAKYYPEGYLYPNTYDFFEDSTPEEVFNKLLNGFSTLVWSEVSDQVDDVEELYNVVTMASVIEKETGRSSSLAEDSFQRLQIERKNVASAFYNRNEYEMMWQSNPTVEYGQDYKLCESTFEREGCKYLNDQAFDHLYSTYLHTGYPVGPISSPQLDNILAALNPSETDYLYFVADLTGYTYFASSAYGHEANIAKVQEVNASLE